ncbi:MAG: hypothetical protein L0207_04750 [Chlamydiae bacterium]|nr:hypothetical protein [Chlamydiota bacterium]
MILRCSNRLLQIRWATFAKGVSCTSKWIKSEIESGKLVASLWRYSEKTDVQNSSSNSSF